MTGQLFALTSFMALLGLWAFAMTGSSNAVLIAIAAIAYAAGLSFEFKKKVLIPSKAWNIIAIPVFAVFLADYLFLSRDIVVSGSRLLAVLFGLKLFDLRKGGDYLVAFALVFFQILAAAVSTVSLAFFLMLSLYLMASIWAMTLVSVMREMKTSLRGAPIPAVLFGTGFFPAVAALTALSLVITLALFFFLPRVGVDMFQRKAANALKVTGFSETVDLGSLGQMKEDPTIIMRAEFPAGRPGRHVYFRGVTLEKYDGKRWRSSRPMNFIKRAGPDGWFNLGSGQGRRTEFTVLLEPLDTEVLFVAQNIYRLEGSFELVRVDRSGVLRLPSAPFSRVEYTAWTDLSAINSDEPAPAVVDNDNYLSSSPEGEKIRELASKIAKEGTPLEKAAAIEAYLKANYRYNLSPRSKGGSGPLEDFLFHSKEGYCEHFATSMVMLLRASNIPARIVTGFLEGEWNDLGWYFIVRQQDAHSWVEAYIEGTGWVRFDPTPYALRAAYRPSMISLYLDLMKLKWNRYIIQFSAADQRSMAHSAERGAVDLFEKIRGALKDGEGLDAGEAARYALALAALILAAAFWKRGLLKKHQPRGPGFYPDMLKTLARRGLEKKPSETPLEFARRVNDARVLGITEAYQLERYGGVKTSEEELEKIRKAVRDLKKGRPPSDGRRH